MYKFISISETVMDYWAIMLPAKKKQIYSFSTSKFIVGILISIKKKISKTIYIYSKTFHA